MSQYRQGKIISTGAAFTLPLGFIPDHFTLLNYTKTVAQTGVGLAEWIKKIVPSAQALISTYSAGVATVSLLTSNGVTPVILGGDWQNTDYIVNAITNANPGVVTVASITPTNSMTLVNGMTFTLSNVMGMKNLNTNRFVVAGLTIVGGGPTYTFNLYDTFGNPVDTTALGTFVFSATQPAVMDVISYPPTPPILDPVSGQVITPGSPAGLQYDIGYEGLILGTGVVGSAADVLWYEALYQTPTGY
jgi:hypothetical protein